MIELGARSPGRPTPPSPAPATSASRLARGALASLIALSGALAALSAPPPGAAAGNPRPGAPAAAPNLADWTGGINLYRDGVFTTQSSWLYCTAADVQMTRNMVEGTEDHSGSAQTAYFDWMRTQNQYDLPLSAGVDPAGWTAGMRHFVNDRYRLVSTTSFGLSLQLAVVRMRLTGLPVSLAVAHGNHGWILNGFTATADPAVTTDFDVTSVSVTGPLWGLQSKGGYDMPPNTTLSVDQLRTYFTRWHYDPLPMVWDGTFVSIQPLTDKELAAFAATPTPAPLPTPTPTPTPATPTPATPTVTPTPTPATPTPAPPTATPTLTMTPTPADPTTSAAPDAAVVDPSAASSPGAEPASTDPAADTSAVEPRLVLLGFLVLAAVVAAGVVNVLRGRGGRGRRAEDRR